MQQFSFPDAIKRIDLQQTADAVAHQDLGLI